MSKSSYLLAYGHLRQGGEAQHLMAEQGASLAAQGQQLPGFQMRDSQQGYPFAEATNAPEAMMVVDLYEVPASLWPTLDAYEDVEGGLYYRQAVAYQGRSCFIYLTTQDLSAYPVIQGGDWLAFRGLV